VIVTRAAEVVTIESLAAGGAGVAHLADGITVFVPRTAPGDRVTLRDVRRHRRHAEAEVGEMLQESPGRVAPPCAHFTRDRCGGCQWQHLPIETQRTAKQRIVGEALRRIGKLDVADPELVESPRTFGYRTTITLTVRPTPDAPVVGFHQADGDARVFPLERCEIAHEELNALWTVIRPALAALPPGDDVRLKLRVTPDGGLHLVVLGGEGAWRTPEPLAQAARDAGLNATVWWHPEGGAPRRMAGSEPAAAALGFEQVNAEVAAALRAAVLATATAAPFALRASQRALRILDLYAGAGETALPLAERGHDVVMVEVDARAIVRAEERARRSGIVLRCVAARVEDRIGKLLPADVVIVNPPRTGLAEGVTDSLRSGAPARLVYVSCDPATLARDLRRLGVTGGDLVTLQAFDMFPQTSHVETLAVADLGRASSIVRPPSSA